MNDPLRKKLSDAACANGMPAVIESLRGFLNETTTQGVQEVADMVQGLLAERDERKLNAGYVPVFKQTFTVER